MPYCSRCGVEIAHGVKQCILCNTPVQVLDLEKTNTSTPYPVLPVPDKVRNIISWVITTTIFFVAAFVTIAIDIMLSKGINWAAYPVTGILVAWSYITLLVFLIRKRWIAVAGWIIITAAYLGALNIIDTGHNWFLPLGLPLTLLSGVAMTLVLVALTYIKSLNGLLAMLLGTIALLCCGVDFTIKHFLGGKEIGWSLIVLASVLPVEGLFLFYALYLRKHVDLRKYFHL